MTTLEPTVSQTVHVRATPERVYGLITDLAVLAELADEATAMRWTRGSTAVPGAVFRGSNRNGLRRWSTRCTVSDAVPGRVFAFEVDLPLLFSRVSRWQYDIEPDGDGARVTESTWDRRSPAFAVVGTLATGVKDRDAASREHIAATLRRLVARAESA